MSILQKLTEQKLLVHAPEPTRPWEITIADFECLLTMHAFDVGVVEFRTEGETIQRGHGVVDPSLGDADLIALLVERVPDARYVRITRPEICHVCM